MEHKSKIEYINTGDLIPYCNNSRVHSDEQVNQVAASLKEFGFTNPVLIDEANGIIAGHCRVMAANKLKIAKIPTIRLGYLTKAQKKAYIIADNKIATNSTWDDDLLKVELESLNELDFDLSLTGFSDEELDLILDDMEVENGLTDEDHVPDVEENKTPVTRLGDVWTLGNHRLMCGDSTNIDDIDKLLGKNKIDLVFTDPPYNVAYKAQSGKHEVIKNDNLSIDDFNNFIDSVCSIIDVIKPKHYYIWCNWAFYSVLQNKLKYKACIVWAKNFFGMGIGYRHQHEFCLFNGDIDRHIKNESDLWQVKKDVNYVHPTQKPVELGVRAFSNHAKSLNVLDMFGGSGSTMIASEQTGRKCFMMELEPCYCDVIIKRWQEYTGKEAYLESSGKSYREMESKNG